MQECFIIQIWGKKILLGREYTQFKDTTRRHAHTHTHTLLHRSHELHVLHHQMRWGCMVADLVAVLPPSNLRRGAGKASFRGSSASVANPKTTEFNHISFEIKTSALFFLA